MTIHTPICKFIMVKNTPMKNSDDGKNGKGSFPDPSVSFHWSNPSLSLAKFTEGQGPKQSLQ